MCAHTHTDSPPEGYKRKLATTVASGEGLGGGVQERGLGGVGSRETPSTAYPSAAFEFRIMYPFENKLKFTKIIQRPRSDFLYILSTHSVSSEHRSVCR